MKSCPKNAHWPRSQQGLCPLRRGSARFLWAGAEGSWPSVGSCSEGRQESKALPLGQQPGFRCQAVKRDGNGQALRTAQCGEGVSWGFPFVLHPCVPGIWRPLTPSLPILQLSARARPARVRQTEAGPATRDGTLWALLSCPGQRWPASVRCCAKGGALIENPPLRRSFLPASLSLLSAPSTAANDTLGILTPI